MQQKTWIDLLGTNASNCEVVGTSIMRRHNDGSYWIIDVFEDHTKALRAMHHWKNEIAVANAPTVKIINPPMPEYELGGEG